jgi:hypothetical protein
MKQTMMMLGLMLVVMFGWNVAHAQLQRSTNLGDVVIRYCNDATVTGGTKSLVFDMEPEQTGDICMIVTNGWPTDAVISLNFVDGSITSDEDQKKACEPEETKTNFGQYVTGYPTTLSIKAGESTKVAAKVLFPAGYAGTAYGCTTFQVLNSSGSLIATGQENQMFTILTRRASFVDINVKGDYVVDLEPQDARMEWSFSTLNSHQVSIVDSLLIWWHNLDTVIAEKNPLALRLGKSLTTRSVVINSGNVWLNLSVQSQYRAWWWLVDLDQWSQIQKLVPKQRKTLEFDTNHLAWWLGGPVTVTYTITYQPIIIGSWGSIDPALLEPQTMILTSSGFITAWAGWGMFGSVFVVILGYVLYLIRRHASHRHPKRRVTSFKGR